MSESIEELKFTKKSLLKAKETMIEFAGTDQFIDTSLQNIEKALIEICQKLGEEDE